MSNQQNDPASCTGRTANRIILLVRTVIANPNVDVTCEDHNSTEENNLYVAKQVCEILDILSVDYMRKVNVVRVLPIFAGDYK